MQLQLQQQAATAAAVAMRADTPAAASQQQPWMMTPGYLTNPGNYPIHKSVLQHLFSPFSLLEVANFKSSLFHKTLAVANIKIAT